MNSYSLFKWMRRNSSLVSKNWSSFSQTIIEPKWLWRRPKQSGGLPVLVLIIGLLSSLKTGEFFFGSALFERNNGYLQKCKAGLELRRQRVSAAEDLRTVGSESEEQFQVCFSALQAAVIAAQESLEYPIICKSQSKTIRTKIDVGQQSTLYSSA